MSPLRTARRERPAPGDLATRVRARNFRAIGQAISVLESGEEGKAALVSELVASTGRARRLGITGPPGAGKSTLVDRLAAQLRLRGETVGILCVDPTSPFSGGAILGDRIRMQGLATDPGVFIRSMATRGAMGGLAQATRDAMDVLDAAGFDWVLVETVGVGQDEVDVISTVDTVVVVVVPGLGDDVQAIKAGVMEIADIFVLNKADRDGADRTFKDLALLLSLADSEPEARRVPILRTVASRGEGIEELVAAVLEHRVFLERTGELSKRRTVQLRARVEGILQQRVLEAARARGLEERVRLAAARREDPYLLAEGLLAEVCSDWSRNGKP